MGYFIRVLGKTNAAITVDNLQEALKRENLDASMEVEEGTADNWIQIVVRDRKKRDMMLIEKSVVAEDEVGKDEIEEFKEEVTSCKPASAATWLLDYFDHVQVIYAFQILNAVDNDESWEIVGTLKSAIWNKTQGILQADNEGFSNEDGYHILWQFSDAANGPWYMAVLNEKGHWVNFKMELGDKRQRREFCEGNVPKGAELL